MIPHKYTVHTLHCFMKYYLPKLKSLSDCNIIGISILNHTYISIHCFRQVSVLQTSIPLPASAAAVRRGPPDKRPLPATPVHSGNYLIVLCPDRAAYEANNASDTLTAKHYFKLASYSMWSRYLPGCFFMHMYWHHFISI